MPAVILEDETAQAVRAKTVGIGRFYHLSEAVETVMQWFSTVSDEEAVEILGVIPEEKECLEGKN